MANTLNPLTDTPTSKTQITKPFMIAYMRSSKATDKDRKWFKDFCLSEENQKFTMSNLPNADGKIDVDIKKLRVAFCQRFYPQLVMPKGNKNKSFLEMVQDL